MCIDLRSCLAVVGVVVLVLGACGVYSPRRRWCKNCPFTTQWHTVLNGIKITSSESDHTDLFLGIAIYNNRHVSAAASRRTGSPGRRYGVTTAADGWFKAISAKYCTTNSSFTSQFTRVDFSRIFEVQLRKCAFICCKRRSSCPAAQLLHCLFYCFHYCQINSANVCSKRLYQ